MNLGTYMARCCFFSCLAAPALAVPVPNCTNGDLDGTYAVLASGDIVALSRRSLDRSPVRDKL